MQASALAGTPLGEQYGSGIFPAKERAIELHTISSWGFPHHESACCPIQRQALSTGLLGLGGIWNRYYIRAPVIPST
jgi:hypothetical protein